MALIHEKQIELECLRTLNEMSARLVLYLEEQGKERYRSSWSCGRSGEPLAHYRMSGGGRRRSDEATSVVDFKSYSFVAIAKALDNWDGVFPCYKIGR